MTGLLFCLTFFVVTDVANTIVHPIFDSGRGILVDLHVKRYQFIAKLSNVFGSVLEHVAVGSLTQKIQVVDMVDDALYDLQWDWPRLNRNRTLWTENGGSIYMGLAFLPKVSEHEVVWQWTDLVPVTNVKAQLPCWGVPRIIQMKIKED